MDIAAVHSVPALAQVQPPRSIARPTSRRTPLRQSVTGTRQHNRLVAAVAATTETEAEAVEEQPVEQPSVEAPEAQQTERKSFRKERNDRSNKTPITDLAVGQQLEGTVVGVKDYGAFVDVGAQTDGLLHISKLSASFVRNVADFVSVGAKVSVRIISIELEKNKFALSLLTAEEEAAAAQAAGEKSRRSSDAPRRASRNDANFTRGKREGEGDNATPTRGKVATRGKRQARPAPTITVKKGEEVVGKVAKTTNFGVFVDLEGGVQALVPASELVIPDDTPNAAPRDLFQPGDEFKGWVLRVDDGKVALTARSEELRARDKTLTTKGIGTKRVEGATTTMQYALAAAGLVSMDTLKKGKDAAAAAAKEAPVAEAVVEEAPVAVEEEAPAAVEEAPVAEAVVEEAPVAVEEEAPAAVEEAPVAEAVVEEAPAAVEEAPAAVEEAPAAKKTADKKAEDGAISASLVKQLREASGAGMMDCKKALKETNGDVAKAQEYLRLKGLASAEKKAGRVAAEGAVWSYIHAGARLGVLVEVNCETDFVARGEVFLDLVNDVAMQVAASPDVRYVSIEDIPADFVAKEKELEAGKEDILSKPEGVREKMVEGRVAKTLKTLSLMDAPYIKDPNTTVAEHVKSMVAKIGENIQIRRFHRFNLGEGIEKKESNLAEEVAAQTAAFEAAAAKKAAEAPAAEKAAVEEAAPAVQVSAALVKQLRESSGAGMMDCKKALAATGADLEKASEWLRKKGLAGADKKAGRVAADGAIGTYIHSYKMGVLVEVNCETDFVARGEKFNQLVTDIAMQIAACPQVDYVNVEDFPAEELARERAIELQKEDLASKPEAIREKMVEGRVAKIAKERALLEQDFIKDTSKTVGDYIKETIAATGENIQVRRFVRFNLGEGIEKKTVDFAAEVAAQTGGLA